MKYNNLDINLKVISEVIRSCEAEEKLAYINIFSICGLLYKNLKKDNDNSKVDITDPEVIKKLDKLEEKVYTVDGKVLTEKTRVTLEIYNINKFLEKNKENIPQRTLDKIINEAESIRNSTDKIDFDDPETVMHVKRKITMMQAHLGMRIKFYNAALETISDIINNTKTLTKYDNNNTNIKSLKSDLNKKEF